MEFTLTSTFQSTPEEVYTAWLNSDAHSAMTGGEAKITNALGSSFTAWNEYITGRNLILEPHSRIVQAWRTTEFDETEDDSQVELLFKDLDGKTEVTLIHTGLSEQGEQYIKGWKEHYFAPMKEYFSK